MRLNSLPFAIISTKLFASSDTYELMQDLIERSQNGLAGVAPPCFFQWALFRVAVCD
jgi:hypothetical protein